MQVMAENWLVVYIVSLVLCLGVHFALSYSILRCVRRGGFDVARRCFIPFYNLIVYLQFRIYKSRKAKIGLESI